jgi:multicomponent Na+:H+ antiporter subunit E
VTILPQLLLPGLALTGLWWLLSAGAPESWLVGAPTVALALWVQRRQSRHESARLSLIGLLRFLPFFIAESVRGGLDVAQRTLAPQMRINPGLSRYRTRLRRPAARLLFTNCVSLLPGTLAARLVEVDQLELHLLDADIDPEPDLRRLERAVARVFPELLNKR